MSYTATGVEEVTYIRITIVIFSDQALPYTAAEA